jgi:SAM-dependent methyltransferase
MRNLQSAKFGKRKRNEDPDEFRDIIKADKYLFSIYSEILNVAFDHLCLKEIRSSKYSVLELGSSGGITSELNPKIITTDIRKAVGVNAMVNGMSLPFIDESLDGIIAKDILHHIPDPVPHFAEVVRTLKPGGKIVYIEPNWNLLSTLVFTYLHPEVFDKKQKSWKRESKGPMDANQALAWIVFVRDSDDFKRMYPELTVTIFAPQYGLSYLLAGGVYNRSFIPSNLLLKLGIMENRSKTWMKFAGLNRFIVVEKKK